MNEKKCNCFEVQGYYCWSCGTQMRRKQSEKEEKYICLCRNDNDERFEYLNREGKTTTFTCKDCDRIIKH